MHSVIMYRKNDFKIQPMNVKISFFVNFIYLYFIDLLKDCEVRAGLKTDTWLKVLRSGKVREQQVIILLISLIWNHQLST
jgi:hypothetical protein